MKQVMVWAASFLVAISGLYGDAPAPPTADWESEWILVQLDKPLHGIGVDGAFPLDTGFSELDSAILKHGIQRIGYALPSSAAAPGDPAAFSRWGLDRTYRFYVPSGVDIMKLVNQFDRLSTVIFAEPDYIGYAESVTPGDPSFGDQWQYNQLSDADMDGPEAWDLATGAGAIIAILDTGLDYTHEDLMGREWNNPGEIPGNAVDDDSNGYIDDINGWDFVNDDADPTDDRGHGSRVSSVAAANTNNGIGMAGACWDCRIMAIKVIDAANSGNTSWFADGIVYATDAGARVINYSAGESTPSETRLSAINYAYDAGVVLVGGAGNASIASDMSGVVYPKARTEFIASGGTDAQDWRARPFECSGSTSGSRYGKEVDVVTPASLIVGANWGGGYGTACGNSFSGPLLAGLVGLIHELDPSAGQEEVRHLIQSGAEDEVGNPAEDIPGFDVYHGWGRANMHRTLQAVQGSVSLNVDGKSATRPSLLAANPTASSYDFIRGDLGSLAESSRGVDLGTVVCLENDSLDPDTLGNEDTASPALGEVFFYLARFNALPGAGSFGGSSSNRDRTVFQSSTESWSAQPNQQGALFGTSVGSAGDVNNDGFDDIIVSAEQWDGDQVDEGGAFVYLGSASGLQSTPIWTAEGDQPASSYGWSVAGAGDVNGDGNDDVIVGAPLHDNGEVDEGRSYVYYGNSSGVSATPAWTGEGDQAGAQYGSRVRTAGDVNNDGFDDIIVGAPLYDGSGGLPETRPDRGRAYVYYGSAAGLSPYGSPDWTGESDQAYAGYGQSAAGAGSVNCDAYDDVIVGAPRYDNGQLDEGRVYIYYGSGSGLSTSHAIALEIDVPDARLGYSSMTAGDVNGDGCSDVIVGAYNYANGEEQEGSVYVWLGSTSGLNPKPDWSFEVNERFAQLGISAETVWNVNGDCCDDIIVGAHLLDVDRSDEGQVYVYHGTSSGLLAAPAWTASGGQPAAKFGWRVAGAGDINGDGFGDAIVGDRFYQDGEANEGRVTVYHGSALGLPIASPTSDCPR